MSIKSKNSSKTLALASGTLVVRWKTDGEPQLRIPAVVRRARRHHRCSRRIGDVTVKQINNFTEVRCDVEYGPVFGAYATDLQRQLDNLDGLAPAWSERSSVSGAANSRLQTSTNSARGQTMPHAPWRNGRESRWSLTS